MQERKSKSVSGLVVKHFISLTGKGPLILKFISHPKDLPIQFFCIVFTLFGQLSNLFKLSKSLLRILKY